MARKKLKWDILIETFRGYDNLGDPVYYAPKKIGSALLPQSDGPYPSHRAATQAIKKVYSFKGPVRFNEDQEDYGSGNRLYLVLFYNTLNETDPRFALEARLPTT